GAERDGCAARDPVRESVRLLLLGVIVEAIGGTFDAEVRQELARVARVFAEDQVRRLQRLDRARRKIAEIAERRADDKELACHLASSLSRSDRTAGGSPAGPPAARWRVRALPPSRRRSSRRAGGATIGARNSA